MLENLGGAGVATIRGRRVPEVSLAAILGIDSAVAEKDRTLVVLRPAGGDVYALSVDRIHDHEELVVKPAAPAVMATGLYAGTTLADDGSPILLFDPAGLAQVGGVKLEAQERTARIAEGPATAQARATACCCSAVSMAAAGPSAWPSSTASRKLPDRPSTEAAGQLRVQVGEAILPLAGVTAGELGDDKVRLFRLNDGSHEVGYAFREVIDFATIDNDVIHAERPGEISGVSLINGEPAELVDAHWLFAHHVGPAARTRRAAGLPAAGEDPWMQNMLRPIIEAAGYRVVGEEHEGDADLVIAPQGAEVPRMRREDHLAPHRARGRGQKGREHLSLRPRRAADRAQVGERREGQMNELLLVVTIAGERVALPAAAVELVVELDTLIPVPRAAPHVAGLSALRSRVLTVIDCMRSLELGTSDCSDGIREAAVVELDGHHYALIVDLVEDVVEALSEPVPVRAAMGAGWERASEGMVETENGPLLLVDVAALIAGAEAKAAA